MNYNILLGFSITHPNDARERKGASPSISKSFPNGKLYATKDESQLILDGKKIRFIKHSCFFILLKHGKLK